MIYACTNERATEVDLGNGPEPQPCPALKVPRDIDEPDDVALEPDARICSSCDYPLARFPDGLDGPAEEVEGWTPPPPPPEQEPDYSAQWRAIASVAGAQITQTDRYVEPFPFDMDETYQSECKDHEQEWYDFRQGLRELAAGGTTRAASDDPTGLVWPTLPSAPAPVVVTAPPDFVDATAWPDYIPAA
jgi:hypothetical protein